MWPVSISPGLNPHQCKTKNKMKNKTRTNRSGKVWTYTRVDKQYKELHFLPLNPTVSNSWPVLFHLLSHLLPRMSIILRKPSSIIHPYNTEDFNIINKANLKTPIECFKHQKVYLQSHLGHLQKRHQVVKPVQQYQDEDQIYSVQLVATVITEKNT